MAELARTTSVQELLGKERWDRLARFTLDTIHETEIRVTIDADGPVVTLEEMNRQGALVLGQFLAGAPR